MGRKGNWFSSVKKAFSPDSKGKKGQKSKKSKEKWIGTEQSDAPDSSTLETVTVPHPLPPPEEAKSTELESEQTKHAYSAAVASSVTGIENEQTKHEHNAEVDTAMAAEATAASAQADVEVVGVTAVTRNTGKSEEEAAAIKIQKAFRGYLARRGLRALRGLVRLKLLVQGPPVKRQTSNALRCMQTLARVQCQIQSRRIRMSEENQALQRQLLQKRAKELASLQMGEEWDDSVQSKEQIEANLMSKFEATTRRERAMAYSFSHQQTWKKSTRSTTLMFMDPNNPHWGWSWLERWMATCTLDTRSTTEKELNNDQSFTKSASLSLAGGEITKAYALHQLNSDKPPLTSTQKPSHPSTPTSKAVTSTVSRKLKPASPRGIMYSPDDDAKSTFSVQSEKNRRHSIGGSSVRDDESLASSPGVPSYMAPTKSAKAKSRTQSPLGLENGTAEKESPAVSAKKRLSFPASPSRPPRRHSGPPKVEVSSTA